MSRHFTFKLKDEFIRSMNREQYKTASHNARWFARHIDKLMNWEVITKKFTDLVIYGRCEYRYEDLLV